MFKKSVFVIVSGALLWTTMLYTPSKVDAAGEGVESVKQIHQLVVERGLASLNYDGEREINTNAQEIGVDAQLFDEYVQDMSSVNKGVETGGLEFDNQLQIHVLTNKEMEEKFSNPNKGFMVTPNSDPGAPVFKNIYSLAEQNRQTLATFQQSVIDSGKYSPTPPNSYAAAVGFFVGKVKPNGDWDYKTVPGYSPWYKEFSCNFKNNVREVKNSAYIGNYVYGYVGKQLFSLSTLLNAGDAVSLATSKKLDGEDDKAPIRRGYNESR